MHNIKILDILINLHCKLPTKLLAFPSWKMFENENWSLSGFNSSKDEGRKTW